MPPEARSETTRLMSGVEITGFCTERVYPRRLLAASRREISFKTGFRRRESSQQQWRLLIPGYLWDTAGISPLVARLRPIAHAGPARCWQSLDVTWVFVEIRGLLRRFFARELQKISAKSPNVCKIL